MCPHCAFPVGGGIWSSLRKIPDRRRGREPKTGPVNRPRWIELEGDRFESTSGLEVFGVGHVYATEVCDLISSIQPEPMESIRCRRHLRYLGTLTSPRGGVLDRRHLLVASLVRPEGVRAAIPMTCNMTMWLTTRLLRCVPSLHRGRGIGSVRGVAVVCATVAGTRTRGAGARCDESSADRRC